MMILRAMGARKPGPQGERAISVKTIAQGMPDVLAVPVVTAACFFLLQAGHGLRPAPGIPCALTSFEGLACSRTRAFGAARMRMVVLRLFDMLNGMRIWRGMLAALPVAGQTWVD
jgi:hypothetical protein